MQTMDEAGQTASFEDPLPLVLSTSDPLGDGRIGQPADNCYEAAVRQAVKQFRGSPLFKLDTSQEYSRLLRRAFGGDPVQQTAPQDADKARKRDESRGARGVRGIIIRDMTDDVWEYLESGRHAGSLVFRMGLVFKVRGVSRAGGQGEYAFPDWLVDGQVNGPKLGQRVGKTDWADARPVRLYNPEQTDFGRNPPRFDKVVQYGIASTIAIAWELTWDSLESDGLTASQTNPEHYLRHYEVRRHSLESEAHEQVDTLRPLRILCPEENAASERLLLTQFKLVDHFRHESPSERAELLLSDRNYLYTITPVSHAGQRGRPLTVLATRHPDQAPPVPTKAQLRVGYHLPEGDFAKPPRIDQAPPELLPVESLQVEWSEPRPEPGVPTVPAKHYRLVFRRSDGLAAGSYGLDGAQRADDPKVLPTSHVLPRGGDIEIGIMPEGASAARRATLRTEDLVHHGILPRDQGWRASAWRVYLCTESAAGVASPLVPVELLLEFKFLSLKDKTRKTEVRAVGEIEWLPRPFSLPWLPPEDGQAEAGLAHVPMPVINWKAPGVFRRHPDGGRFIRFQWNDSPSGLSEYPVGLHAAYHWYLLDADAHPAAVFADPERLRTALRRIGEVAMAPAEELALVPDYTHGTSLWEAWYPSAVQRGELANEDAGQAADPASVPWYSWRDSALEWPEWPTRRLSSEDWHPFFEDLINALSEHYYVVPQAQPPRPPPTPEAAGNPVSLLQNLLRETPVEADPYGWGVLQRLGLSLTLSLRDPRTHALLTPSMTAAHFNQALEQALQKFPALRRHLHVERLFQPSRTLSQAVAPVAEDALLSIVQLSLRPAVVEKLFYLMWTVEVEIGRPFKLTLDKHAESCSLLILGDSPSGGTPRHFEDALGECHFRPRPGKSGGTPDRLLVLLRAKAGSAENLRDSYLDRLKFAYTDSKPADPPPPQPQPEALSMEKPNRLIALFGPAKLDPDDHWNAFLHYALWWAKLDLNSLSAQSAPDVFPAYRDWSARFFDHGGQINAGKTLAGPWSATAYPRPGGLSLAAAQKDTRRLQWDFPLPDLWAHNYRFHVLPVGRYDQLWRGLGLMPAAHLENPPTSPPVNAGIDLGLPRLQPRQPPVVLGSRRLDSDSEPGPVWEVIIAKHSDQALAEHNASLARRVDFRGYTWTLSRDLSKETREWLQMCADFDGYRLPSNYPDRTGMIGDGGTTPPAAPPPGLPERLGRFQQEALVLHWEGLPYYYEHWLTVAAVDSPLENHIIQRDFGYRTPVPLIQAIGEAGSDEGAILVSRRRFRIRLERYWDCLPEKAQQQWPVERPDQPGQDGKRLLSAFPEPSVVYQLVERCNGNIEVQLELRLDPKQQFEVSYLTQRYRIIDDAKGIKRVTTADGRFWMEFQLEPRPDSNEPITLRGQQNAVTIATPPAGFDVIATSLDNSRLGLASDGAGRWQLWFQGYMTDADIRALRGLFANAPEQDRNAVEALFQLSIERGVRGRRLELGVRLGSASPSGWVPVQAGLSDSSSSFNGDRSHG